MLKGNLAPEGGILKKSACPENLFKHRGPARVFDEDKYAIDALLKGRIKPGDFIIARYEGPRGCPGARKITVLMHTIVSVGLTDSVVLLTDVDRLYAIGETAGSPRREANFPDVATAPRLRSGSCT